MANRSNKRTTRSTTKAGLSRRSGLLRSLDRFLPLPSAFKAQAPASYVAMEALEARALLDATIDPNEYTLLDNGTAAQAAIVLLDVNTTAGITAAVDTTDGGAAPAADALNSITIDVSGAAGTSFDIYLSISGLSGSTPTISVIGLEDGDEINLNIFNETINDSGGAFLDNPTGATSGYTAAAEEANADTTITSAGIADGTNSAVAGNLGTTTIAGAVLAGTDGGNIAVTNTRTNSSVGLVSITGGLDLSIAGGSAFSVAINVGTDADTSTSGGVTIGGPITVGNSGISVATEADAGTGTIAIGSGSTVLINGTGGVAVTTSTNSNLGNVNIGAVTMSLASTGGISVASGGGNANIGNFTLGSLTTTGTASGDISVLPNGSGDLGSVSLGAINFGSTGENDISIGDADTAISSLSLTSLLSLIHI